MIPKSEQLDWYIFRLLLMISVVFYPIYFLGMFALFWFWIVYLPCYNHNFSKELGINVLELQFVMLANYDQNIFSLVLDLLKVCLYIKLESSVLQAV